MTKKVKEETNLEDSSQKRQHEITYNVTKNEPILFRIGVIIGALFFIRWIRNILALYPDVSGKTISLTLIARLLLPIFGIVTLLLRQMLITAHIKSNGIKVSSKQFSKLNKIVEEGAQMLDMKTPKVYILQQGGFINAFATRFLKGNYVVLFAPIVEQAFKEGEDIVRFIIGHELGHIKRKHVSFWRNILLTPASMLPLYAKAYSRAREYTCDAIGYIFSPSGAMKGMILLAVGKNLYDKVDMDAWLESANEDKGASTWIAEWFATHPHLCNRLNALKKIEKKPKQESTQSVTTEKKTNHQA